MAYGQANCNGSGGIYFAALINPGAQDGDDGNLDGNCEYMLSLSLFSSNAPVDFVYTGDGTATPTSVSANFGANGAMTVVGTCDPVTVAAFDVFFMGNLECQITNFNLPVDLSRFEVETMNSGVQLSWETSSEQNNEGFFVERSWDGKNWQSLQFIAGHGTTQESHTYTYSDEHLLSGKRFYRLKQVDFDGSFEYSFILSTYFDAPNFSNPLQVFPNPSNDFLQIQLTNSDQIESINIMDQYGKSIGFQHNLGSYLSIDQLPKGIYFLYIKGKQQSYQSKFVKN